MTHQTLHATAAQTTPAGLGAAPPVAGDRASTERAPAERAPAERSPDDPGRPLPPVTGVRLVGGEMLSWSDAEADTRAAAAPPGAAALFALPVPARGRVLVAGPHDPCMVAALTDRGLGVDILLRSLPDAREARLRLGDPAGPAAVGVICGALDRMPAGGEYDAVIALDGLDRLVTPDSRDRGWRAVASALAAQARPGAPVIVTVPNRFGFDRLTLPDRPDGTDGPEPGPQDAPAGFEATSAALARLGLTIREAFAVFPNRSRPALLATADGLAVPGAGTLVAAAFSPTGTDVTTSAPAPAGTVSEPRRLARDAVRHGLGFALATDWMLVTSAGEARNRAEGGDVTPDPLPPAHGAAPALLILDEPAEAFWTVPQVVTGSPGNWQRRLADPMDTTERVLGHVYRDPSAVVGTVPDGDLLEERLLAACARDDAAAMRTVLRGYAEWQRGSAPGTADPARALIHLDNAVDTGDGLVPLDPSWGCTERVAQVVAFLAAARRFARRLLDGGYPHPWPSDVSLDRLALTFATMAGFAPTRDDLAAATRFALDTDPARHSEVTGDEAALAAACAAPWPGTPALGHREALTLAIRRGAELTEARAQVRWLDETLAERNEQLSLSAKNLDRMRHSITYRIGGLLTGPFRFVVRLARKGLRG